jgi:hypothetical protein
MRNPECVSTTSLEVDDAFGVDADVLSARMLCTLSAMIDEFWVGRLQRKLDYFRLQPLSKFRGD